MRIARRLLCRAAAFLWMIFLSAMESITPDARCSTVRAAFLSPAAIAFLTSRIALRNSERRAALCRRCFSACRARLRADAMLAMCGKLRC